MNAVSHETRRHAKLMGSDFEFILVGEENDVALDVAIEEVRRIESLLTEFSETSQTSLINRNAGIMPVQVDPEVYAIIKRCKDLSTLTQGAFDITAGVLKKMYNFKGFQFEMPGRAQLETTLKKVGSARIQLEENNRVYLTQQGMHIGFGAIGKGYAADVVKRKLIQKGIRSGVINASGDLTAFGNRADGSSWKIGIADPDEPSRAIGWIPVRNSCVATSGDYEQYFEHEGVKYSHTIDPLTGKPVTGIKSVTVISSSAELSDGLATAVTIMGVDVGLHFIEQLRGVHCLIITDKNKIYTSRHLHMELNSL